MFLDLFLLLTVQFVKLTLLQLSLTTKINYKKKKKKNGAEKVHIIFHSV